MRYFKNILKNQSKNIPHPACFNGCVNQYWIHTCKSSKFSNRTIPDKRNYHGGNVPFSCFISLLIIQQLHFTLPPSIIRNFDIQFYIPEWRNLSYQHENIVRQLLHKSLVRKLLLQRYKMPLKTNI